MSDLSGKIVPTAVREVHLEKIEEGLSGIDGYQQALVVYRFRNCVIGRALVQVRRGRIERDSLRQPLAKFLKGAWLQATHEPSSPEGDRRTASVVVCTRDRTADLAICIPRLLPLLADGHEIIVVDSCPATDDTARLLRSFPEVKYVLEPRAGAGFARNRGISAATRDFVAFTDDDAQADSQWLRALLRNFDDELVAVVTGITMPSELETEAQFWFEKTNTFSRGFLRKEFDFSNFEPLVAGQVGCTVNLALRVRALERTGKFDEALGPGSLAKCGEDHEFCYRVLRNGFRIVYDPAALVWHRHRRDWPALRRVIYTYGVGVFAWWTRALFFERELTLLKLAPLWFFNHHIGNVVRSLFRRPERVPLDLAWAEFVGAVEGPFAYFRSRAAIRHQQASPLETRLPKVPNKEAAISS
jgi:GT2 family glycosyltransferase